MALLIIHGNKIPQPFSSEIIKQHKIKEILNLICESIGPYSIWPHTKLLSTELPTELPRQPKSFNNSNEHVQIQWKKIMAIMYAIKNRRSKLNHNELLQLFVTVFKC